MAREDMLYAKDMKVWIPNAKTVWEAASIAENYYKGQPKLTLIKDNKKHPITIKADGSNLPLLRNPAILIGLNDLTKLSYLHEPGVMHNLKVRFMEKQAIYTYCGIILVAINPYVDLPLYSSDIMQAYRGRSIGDLEPHIFALAEEAYAMLEREKCNLSIIVSGESGAGKTVSAKYAMRYFAAVGGSESETHVERKVLACSPIMEAFGNAKTTRNDNSSRFGKFTKLIFQSNMGVMNLTGATMHTYLLEKSRVVFQSLGERNYHIFYQLCSSRDKYPELILDRQDKFYYLNTGSNHHMESVADKEQFRDTLQALAVLDFDGDQVSDILKIIASILHLGNIQIPVIDMENPSEAEKKLSKDLDLVIIGDMLKINSDNLCKWLLMRKIESVHDKVLIPNNQSVARIARDALSKHIYSRLFQYIVSQINKNLNAGRKQGRFIGVLDIYGFESFERNSFEQFCINYANEKLQQQFNQHVFKLEQEEYIKEGIEWTMIEFSDNQPCINLMEAKLGIFDLLDEECKMPNGTDNSWVLKLYNQCNVYKNFEKPRFQTTSFLVKHFSETVTYNVEGFLEKNRDSVSKELIGVLHDSEMSLCKQLMKMHDFESVSLNSLQSGRSSCLFPGKVVISPERQQVLSSRNHNQTVGSQFRESLSHLISTLHVTTPHYVRCIKPNDEKLTFKWEANKIVQQLRACGILETVRISAAGFPSRWTYHDFYMRYQLLCSRSMVNKSELTASCMNIVKKCIPNEDKYRFGKQQIFFRAGQVAFLEQLRADRRKRYITIVQSLVRRYIYRKRFMSTMRTVLGIQCYCRGYLARQRAQHMCEERAAITIVKYMRGFICRRRYLRLRRSIAGIQQYARGLLARRRFQEAMYHHCAIQIQRLVRGYLARREASKRRRMIVICQAHIRGQLARRHFKRLKADAKTISYMQDKYKGFENKIISLQQRIDELKSDNNTLRSKMSTIPLLKMKLDNKKALEGELKALHAIVKEKDVSMHSIRSQLDLERNQKQHLQKEHEGIQQAFLQYKNVCRMENENLRKKLDEMMENVRKAESTHSIQRQRQFNDAETHEIYEAYHRTLKEKEVIENENNVLKEELSKFQKVATSESDYQQEMHSISLASNQNGEDNNNSSSVRTLDERQQPPPPSSLDSSSSDVTSNKSSHTVLILKLRNVLEDEKKKTKSLAEQLEKLASRHKVTEDSIRLSELEVENEKLKNDYELLRNSIKTGSEVEELNAHYHALQEELRRRRDECIQLKAVLQKQSQSLNNINTNVNMARINMENSSSTELLEAFYAQKLVNRQLEMELAAITEENNLRLTELTQQIDLLRQEKNDLQSILQSGVDQMDEINVEELRKNERYLRMELERCLTQYSQLQCEMNNLTHRFVAMKQDNEKLILKMQEHGISNVLSLQKSENINTVTNVTKQKVQSYQGVMKFRSDDLDKILHRLVIDMTPRIAIGLLPGFPAYVIFMCIRYTDLINADDDFRTLLSKFVQQLKKVHRNPHLVELRILWLVNSITLLNLLKQYGDVEEYVRYNTERQNQQQLKNFDLYEYRGVVLEIIVNIYQALVKQIQGLIEPHVVPSILDNDEIQRGRQKHNASSGGPNSSKSSPEKGNVAAWKQLINQLEHFYKQLTHFGLQQCYSEQIFCQLLYFICSVAMNCLMLRGEICMWQTGMIIHYNLSHIEEWVREKKMSNDVLLPLAPLTQVSQLLQSRKSENDVDTICDLCTSLSTGQVLKVMKSYKLDDYEGEITNVFIEKLTEKLNIRQKLKNDEFTMDQKLIHPFKVVFKYSEVKLEDIELPKHLKLKEYLMKI